MTTSTTTKMIIPSPLLSSITPVMQQAMEPLVVGLSQSHPVAYPTTDEPTPARLRFDDRIEELKQ